MKLKPLIKNKRAVAGLDLALSVITMLFVIGLLVMIYALMGAELQGALDPVTDNASILIINATTEALGDSTDWFPIVIVITFMVVLILLTVMIIRAIRGSGLMTGGGA